MTCKQIMTSREVVTRAIEFRGPAWLPVKDYEAQSDSVDIACVPLRNGK